MHRSLAVVVLVLSLGLTLAQERQGYTFASIVQFVELNEGFGVLEDAFARSDLGQTLEDDGPFTLFAPHDEAFDSLGTAGLQSLLDDAEALEAFLGAYVVPARLTMDDLVREVRERDTALVRTLSGHTLSFTLTGKDRLVIDERATVVHGGIAAENGVIFVIDRLLDDPNGSGSSNGPLPGMGQ